MTKTNNLKQNGPGFVRKTNSQYDKQMDAFRSSIGNLFTSNDPTLSSQGKVEKLMQQGYWGDVIKSLKIYESDAVIKKLIDESTYCANTKVMFSSTDDEKTKEVYEEWAKRINEDVPNVIPGINTVAEWILLSLLKTGMAVPDFEWQDIDINGEIYTLPMKLNVHPTLAVKLKSSPLKFGYEEVWLGLNITSDDFKKETANADQSYLVKYVEMVPGNSPYGGKVLNEVWHDKAQTKNTILCVKKPNAFALKYKWSAQDTTYYPIPPLKALFAPIAMKHKLQEADMSLLQRVISRIIHVKVGDKDNPPKPDIVDKDGNVTKKGTLTLYSEMWQEGEGTQIFTTDYTVSIEDKIPDLELVLNQAKYIPSLMEIMGAFGIMQDPDSKVGSAPHAQLNLTKYEKYLEDLQKIVIGYIKWLCKEIDKKNPKIKKPSNIVMNPPYIDTATQKSLADLFKMGAVDIYTLLESIDLDPTQIKARKEKQLGDNMTNGENVWSPPTSLVQIAKDKNGSMKEEFSEDSEPGRPTKKEKTDEMQSEEIKQ